METLLIIFAVILLGFLLWIVAQFKGLKEGASEKNKAQEFLKEETEATRRELTDMVTKNMALVNSQINNLTINLNERLTGVTSELQNSGKSLNERMDNAARAVQGVSKELGELGKSAEMIFDVGKDIRSLQEILKAPKLRGNLGEFLLKDLLSQILPKSNYSLPYKFKNGLLVDAAITFEKGIVPVDSKFPLENFQKMVKAEDDIEKKKYKKEFVRDVKKHITKISESYIQPTEGTFDFALMYIPAENVYYETIIKDDTIDEEKSISAFAFSKKVIPVSPNSFYVYLQTILLGLRGLEIEKRAGMILTGLQSVNNEFTKFSADFDKLGSHLNNAKNKYDDAGKKAEKFSEKLTGLERLSHDEAKEEKSGSSELKENNSNDDDNKVKKLF